jgi:hypothetical protein
LTGGDGRFATFVIAHSHSLFARLVAGLMMAAFIACDEEPTRPAVLLACTEPLDVRVSAGLTPTFDWTPACRVDMIEVRSAGNVPMWTVMAGLAPGGAIGPGVRYGSVPAGTLEIEPASALEATYVLTLRVFGFPTGPERAFPQEFTP